MTPRRAIVELGPGSERAVWAVSQEAFIAGTLVGLALAGFLALALSVIA